MKLMKFTALIEGLAQLLEEGMSLPDFYDEVIARTGYGDMLSDKNTEEARTRLENVKELKSSIYSYLENTDEPTLAGFLEEIALYTDIQEYDDKDDAAVMMTMHSAKGLEFPYVYLVGFEDGLFPGMRAIGDREEMEEERRLCYVAITRAKKSLTITHARQRMIYGKTAAALASRFLREVPDSCVTRKGGSRPKQESWSFGGTSQGYQSYPQTPRRQETFRKPETAYVTAKPAAILELNKGDMVSHAAFGRGLVISVMKMGGDALLEIAFDDIGTKRLMAKAASVHMKKL